MGMTREEAIDILLNKTSFHPQRAEAFAMAIKALEQEPCEDCVSREDVMKNILHRLGIKSEKYLLPAERVIFEEVKNAKSVQPTRIKAKWITWEEADNVIPSPKRHECSNCHDCAQVLVNGMELLSDFCPNCGADMRGSEHEI